MIPIAFLAGLLAGRLWTVPAAGLLWVAVLLPGDSCEGACLFSAAGLAGVNALVGVAVHRFVRGASDGLRRSRSRRGDRRRPERRRDGEEPRFAIHGELRGDLRRVQRYASDRASDSFAGVYVDTDGEGSVRALFTSDRSGHEQNLRRIVEHPDRLKVGDARFSIRELEALRRRVSDDREWFARHGLRTSGLELDVPRNHVEVLLENPSERAARALRERYGTGVGLKWAVVKSVVR